MTGHEDEESDVQGVAATGCCCGCCMVFVGAVILFIAFLVVRAYMMGIVKH